MDITSQIKMHTVHAHCCGGLCADTKKKKRSDITPGPGGIGHSAPTHRNMTSVESLAQLSTVAAAVSSMQS